jgi:hypothetical protein
MPALKEPPTIPILQFGSEDLFLIFDALDNLLDSRDEATQQWLCETVDTSTFRQRTESLRSRIAHHLD